MLASVAIHIVYFLLIFTSWRVYCIPISFSKKEMTKYREKYEQTFYNIRKNICRTLRVAQRA